MIHHVVSLVGFVIFAGVAWLLSSDRRRIAWKTIAWGVALQLVIGLIIFRLPGSHRVLLWLNDAVLSAVQKLKPLAAEAGCSLPQFALAWVLREPNVASAIVGASKPEQLEDNAKASGLQIDPALFAKAEAIVREARRSGS